MTRRISTLVLTGAAVALTGCGWLAGDDGLFRDRQHDYRAATTGSPLEVPPGLSSEAITQEMTIPGSESGMSLSGKFEVPQPEPLSGNPADEGVRIQSLGDERWILVEAMPGEVWPRIRQFLAVSQLGVGRLDAQAGIIDTAWLQPLAEDVGRERYRFRIEQGIQRNSSEIYILQAGAAAGESWPAASTQPEREAEMVRALAQFIADHGSSGAVSMIAQRALDARGRVFLERREQQVPTLRLQLPFDRSWASLEAALPRAGFVIDDRNLSDRRLWVRYDPATAAEQVAREDEAGPAERDEGGLFSSLWGGLMGGDDDDEDVDAATVYVIDVERLDDNQVRIGLSRQDERQLSTAQAESLLLRIKSNLS